MTTATVSSNSLAVSSVRQAATHATLKAAWQASDAAYASYKAQGTPEAEATWKAAYRVWRDAFVAHGATR